MSFLEALQHPYRINRNNAGLRQLYYTAADDLLRDPLLLPGEWTYPEPVDLAAGAAWHKVAFTRFTASLSEKKNIRRQGVLYDLEISAKLAMDSPDIAYAVNQVRTRRVVLLILDLNGHVRLIGRKRFGLTLTDERVLGQSPEELNHIALMFSGECPYPSVFMDPGHYADLLGLTQDQIQNYRVIYTDEGRVNDENLVRNL